ncbi:MAG: polyprenol monophosphomannose synthase [Planctomycetes bacterium]|nr:polyprenol monophosphomannose synthase [Planctomycetota bacterium]
MSSSVLAASIIVPTFREAPNIEPLVQRVFAAVSQAGIEAELIIVDDDSQDGTEGIVEALGAHHPVRLIVRRGQRGLAGAVLAGLNAAKYDRFVVLDADLQHPPELIPTLLARLDQDSCDFVIGSRYAGGGVIESNWPLRRRIVSRVASLLAAPLAPLSDPLSGFFALHRRTFEQAERLDPIGYKIALELYVKGRCHRPAEVPIKFATRTAGQSKLTLREQVRYLRHLWRLYRFRFPWLTRVAIVAAIACASWLLAGFLWPADGTLPPEP